MDGLLPEGQIFLLTFWGQRCIFNNNTFQHELICSVHFNRVGLCLHIFFFLLLLCCFTVVWRPLFIEKSSAVCMHVDLSSDQLFLLVWAEPSRPLCLHWDYKAVAVHRSNVTVQPHFQLFVRKPLQEPFINRISNRGGHLVSCVFFIILFIFYLSQVILAISWQCIIVYDFTVRNCSQVGTRGRINPVALVGSCLEGTCSL